jgi:hypothetical protein
VLPHSLGGSDKLTQEVAPASQTVQFLDDSNQVGEAQNGKRAGTAYKHRALAENLLVPGIPHSALGWRRQRLLLELKAIRHVVGSLISRVEWLQPKAHLAELHLAHMRMKHLTDASL